ncbi:uncharacterized protein LOC116020453 [Ipomoea triloba]|uniref:uncharacterized protein LOC116020453 n=1 Tax=Ipomoea triloba TaxID=35885 RepID=UPI00125D0C9B|nr:uncharacterized protein LOC116020453 [Ipomoea triloba]
MRGVFIIRKKPQIKLQATEKVGRVPHPEWLRRGFCEAVRESGLSDFGIGGCQFTWERGRGTTQWVREKLDRVLVSGNWRDAFPRARAWSVKGTSSDHLPLHLCTNWGGRRSVVRRPRYENSWGKEQECKDLVESAWYRDGAAPIMDRIERCSREVWQWGRRRSSGEREELKRCKQRMGELRNAGDKRSVWEFGEVQRKYMALIQNQSDH